MRKKKPGRKPQPNSQDRIGLHVRLQASVHERLTKFCQEEGRIAGIVANIAIDQYLAKVGR